MEPTHGPIEQRRKNERGKSRAKAKEFVLKKEDVIIGGGNSSEEDDNHGQPDLKKFE